MRSAVSASSNNSAFPTPPADGGRCPQNISKSGRPPSGRKPSSWSTVRASAAETVTTQSYQNAGRILVRHLGEPLGDGARGAERHVGVAEAPADDRSAVADAPVGRVGRAAGAVTGFPVAGDGGARRLEGGADGRIELGRRVRGRGGAPLPPFVKSAPRGR